MGIFYNHNSKAGKIKQTLVFFVVCLAVTIGRLAELIGNFVYLWIIRPITAVIMRIFWELVKFFVNLIPERKGMIVIGIVAAIVGFAILMGHKGKKRTAPLLEDEREELLEVEPPATKLRKRSLQPEIVVRFHYRAFMCKVDNKTRNVLRSDTTAEIAKKYDAPSGGKADAVEELTDIYRRTRYSKNLVTRQDASRVKILMKEI